MANDSSKVAQVGTNMAHMAREWRGREGGGSECKTTGPDCKAPCKSAPCIPMRGGLFPGTYDRPKLAQIEPQMQLWLPKMMEIAPKSPQDGSKTAPRWPEDGPKSAQNEFTRAAICEFA